jgi:hypothetical protein
MFELFEGGNEPGRVKKSPLYLNVRKIAVKGRRKKPVGYIVKKIGGLGFTHIEQTRKALVARSVESEDLNKNPYSYITLTFRKNGVDVEYSMPPEMNGKKRMVDVCRLLLDVLALVDCYDLKLASLYKFLSESLSGATEFVGADYEQLKNRFDSLLEENEEIKAKYRETADLNERNNKLLLEKERLNGVLKERIRELEGMSNQTLEEELFEWLGAHNGEIDVLLFSKLHNMTPARVEEGLDRLLKEGYIARAKV